MDTEGCSGTTSEYSEVSKGHGFDLLRNRHSKRNAQMHVLLTDLLQSSSARLIGLLSNVRRQESLAVMGDCGAVMDYITPRG